MCPVSVRLSVARVSRLGAHFRNTSAVKRYKIMNSSIIRTRSRFPAVPNADLSVGKRARCLPRNGSILTKTSLCAVFAAYRVFDSLFVSRWPRFSRRGVVKRRCARMLLKSHSRLRETNNRIKKVDTSRAKRPCEMRSKSGPLAYARRVSESVAYAKHRF